MKRKESIVKQWKASNPGKGLLEEALLSTEYGNYVELCCFCGEAPLKKDIWLEQEVKPLKGK